MEPRHISVPADQSQSGGYNVSADSTEPDGICHCAEPAGEAGWECGRCHRLCHT